MLLNKVLSLATWVNKSRVCTSVRYTSLYNNNLEVSTTIKNKTFKGYRTSKIFSICQRVFIPHRCFSNYHVLIKFSIFGDHSLYFSSVVMMMRCLYNGWQQETKSGSYLTVSLLFSWLYCLIFHMNLLFPTLQIPLLSQMTFVGVLYLH